MWPPNHHALHETRRQFLTRGASVLGTAALAALTGATHSSHAVPAAGRHGGLAGLPHFAPKVRNVIFLHMMGGPSQMDLFDYKPRMAELFDKDLPDSVLNGQRITTMTSVQKRLPIAPSKYQFARHGQCGMWVSELLPQFARCVDDVCFIRSMRTPAINHEPAVTLFQTGNQITGRPSLGSWVSYGLGAMNENLPAFVVLVANSTNVEQVQALSSRLWSAGYLPGQHAGVAFRSGGDPVLFLNNPPGVPTDVRRKTLDGLKALNELNHRSVGDPETLTRIAQYELAFRLQASVPELTRITNEPDSTYQLYGEQAKRSGSFAHTALLARRMVERGVRFVQIYHNNWDTHSNTAGRLPAQCNDIDQACYGLIQDLKQRGLFDSTLVIWAGEFGRTIYCQGDLTRQNYGRDHHGGCFTIWMAGGGVKRGFIFGATDDFSFNVVSDPVGVHDFHATVLHLLGIDHERFTVNVQGLDSRLTGVESARVVTEVLE
ncbi:MAG: DUF1501 domain-containing protein [Verrucomicrobiota bacterium]